jgi:hypothetical protein
LIFAACADEDPVRLEGTVVEAHDSTAPLSGASVAFVDEASAPLGSTTTDEYGEFTIDLPPGINVFVTIDAPGFVTSAFPGVIGILPTQRVEGYTLYGVSVEEHEALLATWAGCPGLSADGAIVVGEQRIFGLTDGSGNSPSVNTGIATLFEVAGSAELHGCYLTDDGTAYDPEAEATGSSGAFLVAGADPGSWALEVEYLYAAGQWSTAVYPVWLPADGPIVSPWYPAWVPFGT